MWWRIYGVFFAGIAAAQTYVNHVSIARMPHPIKDFEDVLFLAVTVVVFWIALAASIAAVVVPQKPSILQGMLRGVFVGSSLFLVLLEWSLWPTPFSVITEGTAYWGSIFIPSFWFGLPFIIMGAIVGAKFGGAPLPNSLLAAIAVPVLWMPVTLLGAYASRHLWPLLERAFIALFA
jgi:hypothetical protein